MLVVHDGIRVKPFSTTATIARTTNRMRGVKQRDYSRVTPQSNGRFVLFLRDGRERQGNGMPIDWQLEKVQR
jgi:hypothetical protein